MYNEWDNQPYYINANLFNEIDYFIPNMIKDQLKNLLDTIIDDVEDDII